MQDSFPNVGFECLEWDIILYDILQISRNFHFWVYKC